ARPGKALVKFFTNPLRCKNAGDSLHRLLTYRITQYMKRTSALFIVTALIAFSQGVRAGDITGTVTLKGTPPAEKEITPLKDDANCGKLHATVPTTHFYVAGPKAQLADVIVSVVGISGQSKGASAQPLVIDQKGCEYTPQIQAV